MGEEPKTAVLADEDIEEDPDRWCSYTPYGQELWQIACQWVWNLRLALGQQMQAGLLRDTLVGTRKRSTSSSRDGGKRTGRVRSMALGETVRSCNGTDRELRPFPYKKMGCSVARQEQACG